MNKCEKVTLLPSNKNISYYVVYQKTRENNWKNSGPWRAKSEKKKLYDILYAGISSNKAHYFLYYIPFLAQYADLQ